jgi:hypothetical protein
MLTKLFFPFRSRYQNLAQHWWHRLLTVLFFAAVAATLLGLWIGQNQSQLSAYGSCLELNLAANRMMQESTNRSPFSDKDCDVFLPHSLENFVVALVATVLCSYLLQTLYYVVTLFVVFGAPAPRQKKHIQADSTA